MQHGQPVISSQTPLPISPSFSLIPSDPRHAFGSWLSQVRRIPLAPGNVTHGNPRRLLTEQTGRQVSRSRDGDARTPRLSALSFLAVDAVLCHGHEMDCNYSVITVNPSEAIPRRYQCCEPDNNDPAPRRPLAMIPMQRTKGASGHGNTTAITRST